MRLAILPEGNKQKTIDGDSTPALWMFQNEIHITAREYMELQQEEENTTDLRVLIMSTKYGIITGDTKISPHSKRMNYEDVDRLLPVFRKQWDKGKDTWLKDVNDVCIALSDVPLYVFQRLEVLIHLPRVMSRVLVANIAPVEQFIRWLEKPLREDKND